MKYQVDFKSILIGFFGTALIVVALSFKNENTDDDGRYRTSATEAGVVILDTKTGAYIINRDYSNNGWRKGDFSSVHANSKGN